MNGNQKILITGGFGNVGLWLTNYFSCQNFNVSVLSKRTVEYTFINHVETITCDIADIDSCKKSLAGKQFDYVIHLASSNESFLPDYYISALKVNTLGTRNLLEVIDKSELKNFIYFSTIHVYGNKYTEIDEDTPVAPLNDYASSHYFAECFVKQFSHTHQLPYTIFRLSNSYGAPKETNTTKWYLLFNDLAKAAYEKKVLTLHSNGNPKRDFIWLGDVCEILSKTIGLEKAPNDTFNLCSGQSYKAIEIAEFVQTAYLKIFNKTLDIIPNRNDTTNYNQNLLIKPLKLKKIIPFEAKNKFVEEAEHIFRLLNSKF